MPLCMGVGLSAGDFVVGGDPVHSTQKGAEPHNFRPTSIVAKTAAWIKMLLGMEVGDGLRVIVLDGDPAPPYLKVHSRPLIFAHCRLWPNHWMDSDATWYGNRPRIGPGDVVFDRDLATPRKRAHALPPNFWTMSIVAKRLDG